MQIFFLQKICIATPAHPKQPNMHKGLHLRSVYEHTDGACRHTSYHCKRADDCAIEVSSSRTAIGDVGQQASYQDDGDDGGDDVREIMVARVESGPRHPQHIECEHAAAGRRDCVYARRPDDVTGREGCERHGVVAEHVIEEGNSRPRVESLEGASLLVERHDQIACEQRLVGVAQIVAVAAVVEPWRRRR